jgi:aspartokinase/homoserine dehydrogenase 1
MKFGGSSVGNPSSLARALQLIDRERARGPLAVVVSAMGDATDELIDAVSQAASGDLPAAERLVDRIADRAVTGAFLAMAENTGARPEIAQQVREVLAPLRDLLRGVSLVREKTPQTVDLVLSFGERLSASVVAALLQAQGVAAFAVDARDLIRTDDYFGAAHVDWPVTRAAIEAAAADWAGKVPVVTGFIGRTADGRTTTLGRNGSDYTASLLARALGAAEVIGWTDVPGVLSADPAIVPDAQPLPRMTYMEALELANFGASLFHPRTMVPLIESGIPLRIRRTLDPDAPGTVIDAQGDPDVRRATSVTSMQGLALLDVQLRRLGVRTRLVDRAHKALSDAGITVWMSNTAGHGQGVALVVPERDLAEASAALESAFALEVAREEVTLGARSPVTLLTLVAEAMGTTVNVAGRMFGALGAIGVNVRAIVEGASSRSISCVIDQHDTADAVRAVHDAFRFAHQRVSVVLVGKGTVGGQLLAQLSAHARELEVAHDARIRVVGVCDSTGFVFDEAGISEFDGARLVQLRVPWPAGGDVRGLLPRLARLPVPILVDCTAADGMEVVYQAAFGLGVHVVAANKKPLTTPMPVWRELQAGARRAHRAFHYETTVGASLPVIQTLQDLVRTGDEVELIEGAFSGTLGFLATELMKGVPLSQAVRTAKELGYTEPHPRDDLSGTDAARKALILARELGLNLEMGQVEVRPFVPAEVLQHEDLDVFFSELQSLDAEVAAQVERLRREGRVLRYLARVERPGRLVVGPVEVEAGHPAASLRGAEGFVSFTTARYREYPLIVRGAGAGGSVTAAGVLADVLRIARHLRGG